MQSQDPKPRASSTDNRRRAPREDSAAALRVVIETTEFGGRADNLSSGGVFFFTKDRVRVRVHVGEGLDRQSYSGRLVRVQQMNAQELGFAIEFDPT